MKRLEGQPAIWSHNDGATRRFSTIGVEGASVKQHLVQLRMQRCGLMATVRVQKLQAAWALMTKRPEWRTLPS